ncbi:MULTISPECIES: hypothetical protein [Acinetobacter]|uniref:Lipoprotein n=1 Tax=Acinetobacter piscicola TaxID=2006115 RepID=A0A7S7AI39_9GAMM|nr:MULTISPECIES: hypothetical protein [Acinetobacter]QOW47030.1 hypothetical protein G0028_14690 [Acinetobacter piscicola]
MKNLIFLCGIGISLAGCIDYNILPTVESKDILRNKNGGIVKDCQNDFLLKKSPFTDNFWKENNLPKGTTEFVCVNGKAYLPGKEPK